MATNTALETKDRTKSRIRALLNEAKLKQLFESLTDQTLEDTVKIGFETHINASKSGRNLDEKKTLSSLMPKELRDGLMERFKIDIATDAARITIGETIFDKLMKYIAKNPHRLTLGIYDTLVEHKNYHWIVSLVDKKQDAKGNVMLVPSRTGNSMPMAISSESIINLQNRLFAKMSMVVDEITLKKIKETNMGGLSKAFRDLLAGAHMLKLDFSPDEAMERTYQETEVSDDGKTIKERTLRYVSKSSQTWNTTK